MIRKVVSKVSGSFLLKAAMFMVVVGASAVNLCAVPIWHNEPEMPQSMLDEIMEG